VPKDTHRTATADRAELQLPERVSVAVAELAGAAREGLLALAVGTGLQVLQAMLAEDVARLVGPKGRHNPDRTAVRHGSEPGQVTLGGRRVRVRRPRVRTADGTGELPVPTYQAFTATELLDRLAVERMLAKLSTRRYPVGLEPVGTQVAEASSGTSKSAVSRRFVARTEHALAELLAQDLTGMDLVVLLVYCIRVAEHCCVVALGITLDLT
jgi:putative transposase